MTGPWFETAGKSGKAMTILKGSWTDHLRYEITTTSPETRFYCWMLGKPAGMGANDVKIFVDRIVQCCSDKANFEQHFPVSSEIKWTNETKTGGRAVVTLKPGKHIFNIVRGAEPEGTNATESYVIDKMVLSKSTTAPSGTGPAETVNSSTTRITSKLVVYQTPPTSLANVCGLNGVAGRVAVNSVDIHGRTGVPRAPGLRVYWLRR